MLLRWLTRPVVPALIAWVFFLVIVFFAVDLLLMPWCAGRFRPVTRVPSVKGLTIEAARDTLAGHGKLSLAIDTTSEYSPAVAPQRIVYQMPPAGSEVKEGRRVWVRVSKGRKAPQAAPSES